MNICILTTRLNSVWLSMQEIIPALENQWIRFSATDGHHAEPLLVDDDPGLKKSLSKILKADLIIITAFNHKVAIAMRVIREFAGLKTPFVFYLHGQSSIGLWPVEELGVLSWMHEGDVFISTCTRDKQCFDALFENSKALLVPFQLNDIATADNLKPLWNDEPDIHDFVFVGRISEQKNLHTLIYAFSLLSQKKFRLHLIGQEDHLGSPNMQRDGQGYLEKLRHLARDCGVEKKVFFHGFHAREGLHGFLKQRRFIFISPSLHSDENFGMAALWSLCQGARAVLTDWGGHTDFKSTFEDQVDLVPVLLGQRGPYVDVSTLVQVLERQLQQPMKAFQFRYPNYYQDPYAFSEFRKIQPRMFSHGELKPGPLVKNVWRQRGLFKTKFSTKVFIDYEDPLAHAFFKLYGAIELKTNVEKRLRHVPWILRKERSIIVEDPHRGEFVFEDEVQFMKSEFAHS